ncbi:MAG TPA: hypothetical protein VMQ40_04165 [Acidimicrobiales bacterium]|nr:hypothetical protein [Acidimicrobiales bacterium]
MVAAALFSTAALFAALAFLAAAAFLAALEAGFVRAGADLRAAGRDGLVVRRFGLGALRRAAVLADFFAALAERFADAREAAPLTSRFAVPVFELARCFCGVTLVVRLRADRLFAAVRAGVIASSSRRDGYLIAVRRRTLAVCARRATRRDARRRG